MLIQFKSTIEIPLQPLVEEYGFQINWHNQNHLHVSKAVLLIDIWLSDPRRGELSIEFYDTSHQPHKEYSPIYMKPFRDPERFAKECANTPDEMAPRSDYKNYTSDTSYLVKMIFDWFPELLTGSFKDFDQENRYHDFVKEVDRLTIGPLQKLDYMDPISIKFWNCDFTWMDDLKERLNTEQENQWLKRNIFVPLLNSMLIIAFISICILLYKYDSSYGFLLPFMLIFLILVARKQ